MLPDLKLTGCPSIAHLDQYAGVWAIEPKHARSLIRTVNNLNLAVHVSQHQSQAEERAEGIKAAAFESHSTGTQGVIAVVRLEGVMTKYGSSLSGMGSTLECRRKIRAAARDESVTGILLILDTPGGSVSGTVDLALDVREAAQAKPVYAYCEDQCCSGGYYVASQATKIYGNSNCVVGSIGVYMVVEDWSQALANEGVKVHVVRFGDFKGAGHGTEITDEQLAEFQTLVDAHGKQFVGFVQKGRGLSKAEASKLADGRVHVGTAAVDAKLLDGIQSLDKTLADLAKAKSAGGTKAETSVEGADSLNDQPSTLNPEQETDMSQQTPAADAANKPADAPQAATYTEIAAGCKGFDKNSGDDAKFIGSCLERNLTLAQAKDEWTETVCARLESREQENTALKEAVAKAPAKPAGNKPLADGNAATPTASGSDAIDQWDAAVAENVAKGMGRRQAASLANRQHPGLREASVAAYNAQHK